MPRLTETVERQLDALQNWYLERERYEAAERQQDALDTALDLIDADPHGGLPAPRVYPSLARFGYRWLQSGAYWIAWTNQDSGGPIVTNFFYETADMISRTSDDREPA